ncbi:MAG: galactokinase [Spirochaetales bacterium]|nr:galactokinase [Spirochaetales bacterium]
MAKLATSRIEALSQRHRELFGTKAQAVFSTSGRTELGGNHTDHNLGKVIAGSINLDTIAAVHATADNLVTFASEGYPTISVDLSHLDVDASLFGTTSALISGVAFAFVKRGGKIGGFCANVASSVFKGSGLSSSAAIEVLIGTIFNNLYNEDRFSTTELAIMGQEAENIHFGKPSGLMDQIACANGGVVGIDFLNPSSPIITPIAVDFADYGYNLVITTTGGNHADLTADYASIPQEMKSVAALFGKSSLRDVDENSFFAEIGFLRSKLGNDRAILRAYHYFEENKRVDAMVQALENRDFSSYLSLVTESGSSSFRYLQNIYSPSSACEQGIALAYAMTESFLGSSDPTVRMTGAFRVQGGGFAGTLEAYIPIERTADYFTHMEKLFGKGCCTVLAIRNLPTTRIC